MSKFGPGLLLTALCAGCLADDSPESAQALRDAADPQLLFWDALNELCGRAYAGSVTASVPPDESFEGQAIVMHVRECETGMIRIPFHIGENRSRTWVITSTAVGLSLEHDHRHADGTEDEVTRYGGDTQGRGEATVQRFHADDYTAELVPAAAENVWTIEIEPGTVLSYELRRGGSDRHFRVEFDLGREISAPPPPWGG